MYYYYVLLNFRSGRVYLAQSIDPYFEVTVEGVASISMIAISKN